MSLGLEELSSSSPSRCLNGAVPFRRLLLLLQLSGGGSLSPNQIGSETPYLQTKSAANSTSFADPRHRSTTGLSSLSQILNPRSFQHCESWFRTSFSMLSQLISTVIDTDCRAHARLVRISHGTLL